VRFVEHRGIHGGQQLGHAAVAQRHVGKEQVVVDDHQVGRHGFAPGLHHVAGAVLGAVGAQAVVARAGDQRDHGRSFVQPVHLGQVAAARDLRPTFDACQRPHREAVGQLRRGARLLQAVAAQVAGRGPSAAPCARAR
jgi:hypothetical protein